MRLRHAAAAAGVVGLLTSLTACGSSNSSASGSSGSGGKQYTIAFIPGCTCDPYYSTETAGFKAEAAKKGATAIVQGPANFDPGEQTPVLQAVVRKKPDLIVIDPTDKQAMIAPIKLAIAQGIPVITTGNVIGAPVAITQIAASSLQGGKEAAQFIMKQAGSRSGSVLIDNTEAGVSSVADREKGFRQTMSSAPSLKVLPTQYNNDDQSKAASIVSSTLRAHPDLTAVFATNVLSSQGVANAVAGANASNKIIAVGYDASVEQIRALRAGSLDAVISQDPRRIGALAVDNALRYLEGDHNLPKDQPLKPIVITRDNVDQPAIQKTIYR